MLNNTVNIDTGCVFGGKLTALRYPEREIVSVKAHRTYYEPARPFLPERTETSAARCSTPRTTCWILADVVGKRLIDTRLKPKITIREENAIAALEVMSRFASRSQVAHLSAADDVASRDEQAREPAGTSRTRHSPSTARKASPQSFANRSTWVRALSLFSAKTRACRRSASASCKPRSERCIPAPVAASSPMKPGAAVPAPARDGGRRPPGYGMNSRRTGSVWTAS